MGAGGVGGAEDEVGAIAAEERLDSREGLHQVGAVIVSVVEHNNQVPGIRHCFTVEKCLQIFCRKAIERNHGMGKHLPICNNRMHKYIFFGSHNVRSSVR